jgi:protein-S-isoprenylcysteine O-methyltransferase Ste14
MIASPPDRRRTSQQPRPEAAANEVLARPWDVPRTADQLIPALLWAILLSVKVAGLAVYLSAPDGSVGRAAYWIAAGQQALVIAFTCLIVALFVTRKPTVGPSSSPLGRVVATAGTFAMAVPVARGAAGASPPILAASCLLIIAGMSLAIWSLGCLGNCFGVFPEARGLVRSGPYRYVRHPVYLGEITAALGMTLAGASPALFALFVAFGLLQAWRARLEERALETAFPEYQEYRRHSWRLIPRLY